MSKLLVSYVLFLTSRRIVTDGKLVCKGKMILFMEIL